MSTSLYRDPTDVEKMWGMELVGKRIEIFWDGDVLFYPGRVVRFDELTGEHFVLYENDADNIEYAENLKESTWRLFDGPLYMEHVKSSTTTKSAYALSRVTYASMVFEAILNLGDRNGSSLVAIRKYILANNEMKATHPASFNSLTLKAVNKAIAMNELEKMKNSYRFTAAEFARRQVYDKRFCDVLNQRAVADQEKLEAEQEERGNDCFFQYTGTAAEHNKHLRKALELSRVKRDIFLNTWLRFLKPFLCEKNYFNRKSRSHAASVPAAAAVILQSSSSSSANVAAVTSATATSWSGMPPASSSHSVQAVITTSTDTASSSVSSSSNMLSGGDTTAVGMHMAGQTGEGEDDAVVADEGGDGALAAGKTDADCSLKVMELYAMRGVELIKKPASLHAELHEHQEQGISWMVHRFTHGMPMILGDQMGLGKTLQSIGFLAHLHEVMGQTGPHLIIVPLSVLSNWLSEIERFCPSFRTVRFHGPKQERERIKNGEMHKLTEFDIVVTSFEMLVSEVNYFKRKYMWTTIIVDEGHRLKNEKSQLSEKLRSIPTLCKIILTGTPLQNNLRELWSLLHFLSPDVFSSQTAEKFEDGFDLTRGKIDTKVLRRARRLLSVFMLRRIKEQIKMPLPSIREVTVLVPLTDYQNSWYKQLLCGLDETTINAVMKSSSADLGASSQHASSAALCSDSVLPTALSTIAAPEPEESTDTIKTTGVSTDSDWRKLMNLILQLRKICNHVYLMPGAAPDPYEVGEHIVGGSGKLLMLDRMLPRLHKDGHRVLLFSQFTSMLDILEDYCELRDWSFVRLDGNTNRVQRRLDVRRYNANDSSLFIFLISTRAGGLGLNLASADTVILYDSDWNPQVDIQAMERAHRIGQTKPVRVYRLVCQGSVEERMVSRADKKLFLNAMVGETDAGDLVDDLVDDGATCDVGHEDDDDDTHQVMEIGATNMSKGELASMIRFGANAIFESTSEDQMSDEKLDRLLERGPGGRDAQASRRGPSADSTSSSSSSSALVCQDQDNMNSEAVEMDEFEATQLALKERLQKLKEIDLRQLGNIIYEKKEKSKPQWGVDDRNIIVGDSWDDECKRNRKQRVVLIDGKGSGYGGAVPVLTDNMDKEVVAAQPIHRKRRTWTHQPFCAFCGKRNPLDQLVKCSHCPRVFHNHCMQKVSLYRLGGMFICPHHKCCSCSRSTAAAGGMLFRCVDCLTSYCEDCLPQDEVESIGRCKSLESLGYESKQSYYIRCVACCQNLVLLDGEKPKDTTTEVAQEKASEIAVVDDDSMKEEPVPPAEETSMQQLINTDEHSSVKEEEATQLASTESVASVEHHCDGPAPDAVANEPAPEEEKENDPEEVEEEEGAEQEEKEEEEEEEEDQPEIIELWPSQFMRVRWAEVPDSEEEREKGRQALLAERREKRLAQKKALEERRAQEKLAKKERLSERRRQSSSSSHTEPRDSSDHEISDGGEQNKSSSSGSRPRVSAGGSRKARHVEADDSDDDDDMQAKTSSKRKSLSKRQSSASSSSSCRSTKGTPRKRKAMALFNPDKDDHEDNTGADGKSGRARGDDSDEALSEADEGDLASVCVSVDDCDLEVPHQCDYSRALDIICSHPRAASVLQSAGPLFTALRLKVDNGRFRSSQSFVYDVQHCLAAVADQKGQTLEIKDDAQSLQSLFRRYIVPRLFI